VRRAEWSFHHGWVVVFAGMLTVFAALGLGRFALGMLLPSMGQGLALDYSEMGFISTGNFVGYLVAVVLSARASRRFGASRVVVAGLATAAVAMMLVSGAGGFWQVLLFYFLTGLGSGAANVPIMGLVSHWFRASLRGRAAGFIVIGSGFAIMFSGSLIPWVNELQGAEGWRTSWLLLGLISLAITFVALALLRDDPADLGLQPAGTDKRIAASAAGQGPAHGKGAGIAHLGVIYFLFGFTYVIYATFIVTTLVQEKGFSEAAAGNFWFWVGCLSLLSGPVFGGLSDHLGRKTALVLVFLLQGAAYALVAFDLPETFLYLSIGLFGICAWSVPSIMAAAVGDVMGPQQAVAAFGTITFFFGIGQISGPGLAGMLAQASGGFAGSYLMAAAAAGLAVVLSLLLPRAEKSP
jgi:MFS family permease